MKIQPTYRQLRWNTDKHTVEFYTGTDWQELSEYFFLLYNLMELK